MAFTRLFTTRRSLTSVRRIKRSKRLTKVWFAVNMLTVCAIFYCYRDFSFVTSSNNRARHVRKLSDWDSRTDQNNKLQYMDSIPVFKLWDNPIGMQSLRQDDAKHPSDRVNNVPSKNKFQSDIIGLSDISDSERLIHQKDTAFNLNVNKTIDQDTLSSNVENDSRGQGSIPSLEYLKMLNAERFCGMKKFLLFGMRPRWYQFCRSKSNVQFHHLVDFPRVFSCPALKCKIILHHSEEPRDLAGYDVVIFTNVYEWITPEMWDWAHGNRTESQKWVMVTQESPFYVPGLRPPRQYGNITYDWVDSYRRKSDFYHPYGFFKQYKMPREWNINVTNFMSRKTHLIAWMSSHCETLHWDRLMFVNELKAMIGVDTYGKCGDKEVKWNNKERTYTAIFTKYKFYLSLENSCCDEYLTEKFWRSLKLGVLPIVVGAPFEHYLRVAPPNSFLHVDMFESMDELVSYIRELDTNDEKYFDYFRWRSMGQLTSRPSVDHFLLPLANKTHCSILTKYVHSNPEDRQKLDYYSSDWDNTCSSCSRKGWMKKYMLDRNNARVNEDIWA
ncbi:putative glycoprotein 3-alpha-L-fucosyltransferase A-like [Apostichopus japonicus]|uniref:Fucosyltransferase n=1 Tax=Stichopus japonicus TaxID=307972 RepID=A0A2G8KV55_STIJA|nr:putative glycoprotein 3-alpha-L-fucosyltransferase A-like [Apostichopus japonicus]